MKALLPVLLAATLAGCVAAETPKLEAGHGQQAIVRDGNPAVVSKKPASIVIARPASRQFQVGARPSYVVAIFNAGRTPLQFSAAGVSAEQIHQSGSTSNLKVFSFEELVQEEKTRQAFEALAVGLAAAGNSMSAANAGYYRSHGTVYGPRGSANFTVTGYDPVAASIAQSNATMANAAMIDNAVQTGQRNMAALEGMILKDNTIMPGEWYGGRIIIQPLAGDGPKAYRIQVQAGNDRHEFSISHVKSE